jgi:ATP-binding cassette subfamily B protein
MRPAARRMDALRSAFRLVRESAPGWTAASVALVVAQGLLPVAALYFTKRLVDAVAAGVGATRPEDALLAAIPWIVLAAGAALLGAVLRSVATVVSEQQAVRVTDHVTELIHRKSSSVDLGYYEDDTFHDTLHRAQLESPYRPTRMVQSLSRLLQNSLSLAGVGALLFLLHWGVAAVMLCAVVPGVVLRLRHARRMHEWRSSQTPTERRAWDFHRLLTDGSFAKEIRMLDLGELFRGRHREARRTLREGNLRMALARSAHDLATQVGAIGSVFVLVAYVAWRAIRGAISLGDMVMYLQALTRCQGYLQEVLSSLLALHEDALFLSHLQEFLAIEPRVAVPERPAPVPRPMKAGFQMEEVSFRYREGGRSVLEGVSLAVRPGEIVALVGENGSGKTTLAKLLCRLHDPTGGRIAVDGVDLRELDPRDLRREVSVVFQDYVRYPLSARENIWVGDVASRPEGPGVVEAARRAGADRFVAGLPSGYDTVLSSQVRGGVEISGGEWQKLALARAFLRDAQLVVLDEPTSSLSARAEAEVFRSMRDLMGGRAALLISHRFSTVRLADRICVLHQGRIVEEGSHDELIRLGGRYANLHEMQARA